MVGTRSLKLTVLVSLTVALFPVSTWAQPGWVEEALLWADSGLGDSGADVLILYKTKECRVEESGRAECRVRQAVEILTSDGKSWGELAVNTHARHRIDKIRGWRIGADDAVEEMPSDNVMETGRFSGRGWYDDLYVTRAGFERVETGDVVAFEYRLRSSDVCEALAHWFAFQYDQPVGRARFEVELPDGWSLHHSGTFLEPVRYSAEDGRHVWESLKLPYREEEAYMPSWAEVGRVLRVQCGGPADSPAWFTHDWETAMSWVIEQMPLTGEDDPAIGSVVDSLIAERVDIADQLAAVAVFVRDAIRYVAIEIGPGRFRPRSADAVLSHRYGDCKDKVALLRAMLARLEIPAYPVLASIGAPTDSSFPSPFQFNHCLAAIPVSALESGVPEDWWTQAGWIYYDPTDGSSEPGRLPHHLSSALVLPGIPGGRGPVRLRPALPQDRVATQRVEATLFTDGSMEGRARVVYCGQAAREFRDRVERASEEERLTVCAEYFRGTLQSPAAFDLSVADEGDSVVISFGVRGMGALTRAGDVSLLKLDLFRADQAAPRAVGERLFPVTLGPPGLRTTETVWHLPPGWTAVELDEPGDDSCRLGDIRSSVRRTGSILSIATRLCLYGGTEPPQGYPEAMGLIESIRKTANARALISEK